jgi:hypothetical protein
MTPPAHAAASSRHRPPAAQAATAGAPPSGEAPDDEPLGPGWYESSWDLLSGLDVCEAPAPDAWALACRAAA